jgi:hypothetical protein
MKRAAWHRIISAAALCISFAGCAAQTESKAIHQANIEARADGYDLRRYTADARYNLSGDGRWTVFYEAKQGSVGDHFTVYLDRAGNAELMPGR